MLETRFKVALFVVVALFASFPILGILRGTSPPPLEFQESSRHEAGQIEETRSLSHDDEALPAEMVYIPPGKFLRGYDQGGYDEAPQMPVYLDGYYIDRYEVTNHQYAAFVAATGHRKPGPPSRYAKNMARMRGPNQPVVYVSYEDAQAFCRWEGKRLPTEAEWEKAMRGEDGRLWPWGNEERPDAANWARVDDGFDTTAPVGQFVHDRSPFGVMGGAGNVIEWVADWYLEAAYRELPDRNPMGPDHGTFRVLRGGGYTTTGGDVRVTFRSKMVPDFRDETIGFRCARSGGSREVRGVEDGVKVTGNQSSTGLETRPK